MQAAGGRWSGGKHSLSNYSLGMRILIVEDEEEIANFVMRGLRGERFAVDWAATGEKGLMFGKVNPYDCAVVDIKLPGNTDGLDVCKALRDKGRSFPVIMLSAVRDPTVKIRALNLGADDYLIKPFLFAELLARIRALLRRQKNIVGATLTVRDLTMDTQTHTVARGGRPITLNRKEFGLLEYFMRNPGTILTRSMILDHVWDTDVDQLTNTVDVHVSFLRRKVDRDYDEKLIVTMHGYGYKLQG
jgi:DNA-binding response OmpR family regulator